VTTRMTKLSELPPERLGERLAVIGTSDAVELKVSIPESDRRSTMDALGLDPPDAQIRQVCCFDTPGSP
jgi:hypothetical protein